MRQSHAQTEISNELNEDREEEELQTLEDGGCTTGTYA